MGAVRNAMQRDQQDPTVLDLDPDRSLESQRSSEKAGGGEPPLNKDPAYVKYIRMLNMVRSVLFVTSNISRALVLIVFIPPRVL